MKNEIYEAIFCFAVAATILAFLIRGCSNVGCMPTSIDGVTTNER